jgi:hypothetical protein
LGMHLARVRSASQSPSAKIIQSSLQHVIQESLYGVDINPLSVEMSKFSLWLEAAIPGTPLSFLNNHIQCGNSLLGVHPGLLIEGIQSSYFSFVKGRDDSGIRNRIASRNRTEHRLFPHSKVVLQLRSYLDTWNHFFSLIHEESNRPLPDQRVLDSLWQRLRRSRAYRCLHYVSDLIAASMVWPKVSHGNWEREAPTHAAFVSFAEGKVPKETKVAVGKCRDQYQFFHWYLAFPMVMSSGGFDVVIGNPPYLDAEFLKKEMPYERSAIGHLYTSARGNWDMFIPFTELGIRLLKANGRQGFVTPNKILGADYAKAIQEKYFFTRRLKEIHDFSNLSLFGSADVSVVIVVVEEAPPTDHDLVQFIQYSTDTEAAITIREMEIERLKELPKGFISFPITSPEPKLLSWLSHPEKIADVASVSDGATVGEAYEIRKLLKLGQPEDWSDLEKIKLINTGTIDPFRLLWNSKELVYLSFRGCCPVMEAEDFRRLFANRYRQTMNRTVVLAGMSKRLEAAVAPEGVSCGKSAVLLQPKDGICPYALSLLLNTQAFCHLYRGLFAMRGMNGTSLNIGPRQVELLPIPDRSYFSPYIRGVETSLQIDSVTDEKTFLSSLGQQLHLSHKEKKKKELLMHAESFVRSIMDVYR